MPKLISYPKTPQSKALALAKGVDSLGGTCTQEMAAEKIGMKLGGGFSNVLTGAVKYDLVSSKKGEVTTTSLFKELNHAYTEEERKEFLRQSLLSVPLYHDIHERFKGGDIPIEFLDKLMIREMEVDQSWASKVKGYFITDAKGCGLISDDNKIATEDLQPDAAPETEFEGQELFPGKFENASVQSPSPNTSGFNPSPEPLKPTGGNELQSFVVTIVGPGMNSAIEISEEDDMLIVEAALNKIRRKISASAN